MYCLRTLIRGCEVLFTNQALSPERGEFIGILPFAQKENTRKVTVRLSMFSNLCRS